MQEKFPGPRESSLPRCSRWPAPMQSVVALFIIQYTPISLVYFFSIKPFFLTSSLKTSSFLNEHQKNRELKQSPFSLLPPKSLSSLKFKV
jgi:hypothetical protein